MRIQGRAFAVFAGHLFSANIDLARRSGRKHRALLVPDLKLDGRQWSAYGPKSRAYGRIVGGVRQAMLFGAQQGHRGTRLGEAISVGEAAGREQLQRPRDEFQRHAPPAVGNRTQRKQVPGLFIVETFYNPRQHCGDDKGVGHPFGTAELGPGFGLEGRQ